MLSKKFLFGLVALSYVACAPAYSHAGSTGEQDLSMYAAAGGTAQFVQSQDFAVVGDGTSIIGQDKGGTYKGTYKPDYKIGYSGSVQVGISLVYPLRVELEGTYSSVSVADSDDDKNDKNFQIKKGADTSPYVNKGISQMAGLLNVYYDITNLFGDNSKIAPYGGIGGGVSHITFNDVSRYAFAYQAKLGATLSIAKGIRAYLGGKFFHVLNGENGFEKVKSSDDKAYNIKAPYMSYGPEAGIMVHFSS